MAIQNISNNLFHPFDCLRVLCRPKFDFHVFWLQGFPYFPWSICCSHSNWETLMSTHAGPDSVKVLKAPVFKAVCGINGPT